YRVSSGSDVRFWLHGFAGLPQTIVAKRSDCNPFTQISFARTTTLGHVPQLSGSAVMKMPKAPQFVVVCRMPVSPFRDNSPALRISPSGEMSQTTYVLKLSPRF